MLGGINGLILRTKFSVNEFNITRSISFHRCQSVLDQSKGETQSQTKFRCSCSCICVVVSYILLVSVERLIKKHITCMDIWMICAMKCTSQTHLASYKDPRMQGQRSPWKGNPAGRDGRGQPSPQTSKK